MIKSRWHHNFVEYINIDFVKIVVKQRDSVKFVDNLNMHLIFIIINCVCHCHLFLQFAMVNPRWLVIHKLKVAHFVDKIGKEWVFLTVAEAVEACLSYKFADP